MYGHETPAARVHRDNLAQLGFDGAHVHHHLPVGHPVEDFDGHQGNGVDGRGQYNQVGRCNSLIEGDDTVGQPEPQGFGGVLLRIFDAEYFIRNAAVAQCEGKRASYEAQTRNQYFHTYI